MTPTPLVALAGNPNAGKSALFNALTGARQKVGNYPGVTVERKSGRMTLADGRPVEMLDLPGTYSLTPSSPDEAVTHNVLLGQQEGERLPSGLLIVMDATNLDNHLRFALQLIGLGLPTVVDMAARDGLTIDVDRLSAELGVPVIPTVAVRKKGIEELKAAIGELAGGGGVSVSGRTSALDQDIVALQRRARAIAVAATTEESFKRRWTHRADAAALHPIIGPILLATIMFVMFQAVFAWSALPADMIDAGIQQLQALVAGSMPAGFFRSLITEGLLAGVGAVVVFLPQILILFLFILVLEASGYMVRAAFIMDRLMASVGLSGRAFIPLLSSFACAIPGIMATRTIDDPKDRLTTILIAPLMTCSARLPVYAVVIGAFIPAREVSGGIGLQGLVLFALYIVGVLGAMAVAFVLRRTVTQGPPPGFMMEMPRYQMPILRDMALGLWQRAWIFLRRAGTIIAATTVILWLLVSYPKPPAGYALPSIDYSIAGRVANAIEPVFRPIGFNRDMALALIPAMAAREVAVSALATVYAVGDGDEAAQEKSLIQRLQGRWSLPTALAFLAWFVFAPQCISTIAVVRRETNGWKWTGFMLAYLFALAYVAAGATYWAAIALGL
jgi:ferrous iron transport protein B